MRQFNIARFIRCGSAKAAPRKSAENGLKLLPDLHGSMTYTTNKTVTVPRRSWIEQSTYVLSDDRNKWPYRDAVAHENEEIVC